jgi:hypothetical protein
VEPNIVVTAGWRLTAPLCVVLTAGLDDNLQEQAQLGQAQHFAGAGEKPLPSVSASGLLHGLRAKRSHHSAQRSCVTPPLDCCSKPTRQFRADIQKMRGQPGAADARTARCVK